MDNGGSVMRAIAKAEAKPSHLSPATLGKPIISAEAPPLVQRETIQRIVASEERPTETQSETGEAEAEDAGELDTDELARRVYSEIRRRLSIEWERVRKR
jgi:hypothetical protein